MNKDEIKKTNENLDSAVKVIEKSKYWFVENEKLKDRLKDISLFIREHTYSITMKKERINRMDLTNDEWNKLIKMIEVN